MRIHILIALLGVTAGALIAQDRGSFSGTVTDSQGAAIPGVQVVATETRTGTKATATSEPTGAYSIPFLAPGQYELSAEAAGFKRFLRRGLTLSANEKPVIDIHMEVGGLTESVTVTAESPMIVSSNSSVGQVVTTREVEDIPINGRTPIMLSGLAIGVIDTAADTTFIRPFDQPGGSFSMGGVSGSNEILLDGAPDSSAAAGGGNAYSPPQDAVAEVSVSSFESDAAYGHAGGGTMNLITKSGTNSFHGSASEFNQVSYLEANSFYYNKAGNARPNFKSNQWGLTAGGPLWIPKVYNGKNRVFWFFAYEGLKDATPSEDGVILATVPTAAERQGDFSQLLKVSNSYTIYDPNTGVPSGAQVARTPFPNNVIPTNRLNPIALNYLQFFPQPTPGAGRADGFQNYNVSATDTNGYDSELGRLDVNATAKDRFSFDFRNSARTQNKRFYFPANLATGNYLFRNSTGASLDNVYMMSPTVVLDIRANWNQYMNGHASPADGFDPTTLGYPAYLAANSQGLTIPGITFNSCSVSGGSYSSFQCLGPETVQTDDHVPLNIYQLFGNVVKNWGNHTTKFGADIRDEQQSAFTANHSAGNFVFNSSWTNGPLSNAAASPLGQDFAAFLLGLPSSGQFNINAYSSAVSKYFAFFVQDDWRVRNSLILNLGLRWEHESPTTERYNRVVNGFDPTAANPISAAAAAAYAANPQALLPASQFKALGGLTFANANDRDIYNSNSKIFSPRIGVAWTPAALGGKTVLRGGFGVFVSPIGVVGVNQSGFGQTTQFVATNDNFLTPAGSLSNPFPNGIALPTSATPGTGTFLGQQVTFYNPSASNPYQIRWNVGVQRQLPGQIVLEVAYIGNHAVHMSGNIQLDSVPRQYLSTSPTRDQATINLLTGSVPNPFKGLLPNSTSLNGSSVQLQQLLAPFPQYPVGSGTSNGIIMQSANAFSSNYQSLNVRLQKRLTHGMTIINNFVWSKLIEQASYLNDTDSAPEKRIASTSRPLHDSMAMTYEVPIGRGRKLDLGSRILNGMFGDWALNGTLTLQSGPPLTFGNVIYYGGPLNLNNHQPDGLAFDVTQFNTVSNQQLASNIRTFDTQFNNLRRDPTKNLNLSALKSFSIAEKLRLQVRFETFNTTNRVGFGAPNTTPTSTAFGTITSQANSPRRVQIGLRLVW
ncbi:MAG TPA: carboxypeptidase-like regulatory domain-containing protein [Bryobacteraceae bacterium]|nr:carboxypeptidase-like regulatory domain-containing protein [Bryobacteraceae bacterium]